MNIKDKINMLLAEASVNSLTDDEKYQMSLHPDFIRYKKNLQPSMIGAHVGVPLFTIGAYKAATGGINNDILHPAVLAMSLGAAGIGKAAHKYLTTEDPRSEISDEIISKRKKK